MTAPHTSALLTEIMQELNAIRDGLTSEMQDAPHTACRTNILARIAESFDIQERYCAMRGEPLLTAADKQALNEIQAVRRIIDREIQLGRDEPLA